MEYTTRRLCLVLGDQLSFDLASLQALEKESDTVLMVEVMEEASHVTHHPQKITLIFSAMRHFAEALKQKGIQVNTSRLMIRTIRVQSPASYVAGANTYNRMSFTRQSAVTGA